MNAETAQTIALQALEWLVGNEEVCQLFLGSTGTSTQELRERATDAEFQASILEFITMDDSWVVTFCDSVNLTYDEPLRARYALPGAEQVHWT